VTSKAVGVFVFFVRRFNTITIIILIYSCAAHTANFNDDTAERKQSP
jgi:hypothetical protein